jgi:hypothetical protein
MACFSSGKSAPGGYLIFSDRNRSELLAIKSCSAKRIPSCRRAMECAQNTAHILLHLATAATLIVLLMK